jgi:predicted RNase H-like HicB family nuclease
MEVVIKGQVAWRAMQDRKSGAWVGVCDALRLTAQGDSPEDLASMIDEIMADLMLDLVRDQEFDAFLRDNGWALMQPMPRDVPPEQLKFRVPVKIVPEARA